MNRYNSSGFTMIELLVTVMVVAVVLGIGVPAFNDLIANNRMAAAANDIVSQFHLARTEAIKRRANVTACPSDDSATCGAGLGFESGWIVFVDCSTSAPPPLGTCGPPNLNVDAFDLVLHTHTAMDTDIGSNFTDDGNAPLFISFAPTGFPRNLPGGQPFNANFQLCDHRGNHDTGNGIAAGRWIQISPTGRPQIFRDLIYVEGGQNPLGGC